MSQFCVGTSEKAHWDDFTKDTCKLLLELPDPNTPDIDDAYCQFISAIIKTAKQHIPRGHRKIYIPGWDNECDDLAEKHHAATTEQEKHDTATALMEHLDSARQERLVETVQAIDFTHSSRKAWSVVRRLTGKKYNEPQVPIKANKIAQHVVKNGRNATVNREFTREVNKELKQILQGASVDLVLCSDFIVDEMQQALRSLKSGKAPGPDSIHPEFLMHLGTECQHWLRMFMTNCMSRMKIPKIWRRAKIIAILKPGKSPEEAGSYRPISLLSVCFKLVERLIYNRLLPVVDPQLPREQAGFRPGRSTVEQVVKLTEDIETAFENRKKCGAVNVDLSAAYDTVWHRGLALKMLQLIPNKHMVQFIRELITNRSFKLYVGKYSSKTYTIKNGVPQCSVLAPMLFNTCMTFRKLHQQNTCMLMILL